jgi:hypothetical protein
LPRAASELLAFNEKIARAGVSMTGLTVAIFEGDKKIAEFSGS